MAYNSYSNNKDANKPFDPTTYTAYRFNNGESSVDKTCLIFNMWKQNLKVSIYPRKQNTDEMVFDMENGISVYLNHSRARILAEELKNFLRDPDLYNGAGITANSGVITISNGAEFGVKSPVLVLRKVDDTGNVVSSFAYEFKQDYYFALRGYTGGKEYSKDHESYKYIEIQCMITMLEEYYKAMTYAIAHTVMDANRYNHERLQSRLNAVADKLGVEVGARNSSRGSSYSNSSSFFNNSSAANSSNDGYTAATLDDID